MGRGWNYLCLTCQGKLKSVTEISAQYSTRTPTLFCFSVDRPDSQQKPPWPLGSRNQTVLPTVPIILVATKSELRDDEGIRKKLATQGYEPINTIEGKALAARIGAYAYLECYAKTKEGVDTALDIISQCAFNEKKRRKRHCRSCQIL